MSDNHFDIVIIGSGAGGGCAAWVLSEAGLNVLVLEAGPHYKASDYALHRPDWERQPFPDHALHKSQFSYAPLQKLDQRWRDIWSWGSEVLWPTTRSRRQLAQLAHVRGVGGSTLRYTGEAQRLPPSAFSMRERFAVAADWPLSYAQLAPYYTRIERFLGVAGQAGGLQPPREEDFPLPAHALSWTSQVMQTVFDREGLLLQPNSLAILSRPRDGRPACNYCNNCELGCPRGDKSSVDLSFLPRAIKTGRCEIRSNTQVTRILNDGNQRISGLRYSDHNRQTQEITARAVVLAAGALESPRLLLASADSHSPEGLANESGQVGRNFMESLGWTSSGLYPEQLGSHRGLPADNICYNYAEPDAIPGVIGGCRFTVSSAFSGFTGPIRTAQRAVKGWGLAHKQAMRQQFGRVISVNAIGEFLPNAGSFIELDSGMLDSAGMPVAKIHSYIDQMACQRLQFMAHTARRLLAAAGAPLIEEYGSYDTLLSAHHMGTCRMGRDPRSSVVDGYGRSHRWGNLFICDASLFPSSGGGQAPSLTIQALTLRNAEHIRQLAAQGQI